MKRLLSPLAVGAAIGFGLTTGFIFGAIERLLEVSVQVKQDGKRVLLLAGNAQQAERWRKERGYERGEVIYLHGLDSIRGRNPQGYDFEITGTYYLREDLHEIREALVESGFIRSTVARGLVL